SREVRVAPQRWLLRRFRPRSLDSLVWLATSSSSDACRRNLQPEEWWTRALALAGSYSFPSMFGGLGKRWYPRQGSNLRPFAGGERSNPLSYAGKSGQF